MPRKSAKTLAEERAAQEEATKRAWEAFHAEMVPLDDAFETTVGLAKAVRDTGRAEAEKRLELALNKAQSGGG